jgi:hypothetical protein
MQQSTHNHKQLETALQNNKDKLEEGDLELAEVGALYLEKVRLQNELSAPLQLRVAAQSIPVPLGVITELSPECELMWVRK